MAVVIAFSEGLFIGTNEPTRCAVACVCGRYESGIVTLKAGNALDDPALEEYGPFDAIHVGAAASDLPKVETNFLLANGLS